MFNRLESELAKNGYPYKVTKSLYQTDKVKVVEARQDDHVIVVKTILFPNEFPYEKAKLEAEIMRNLDHQHIIKIYNYFWYVLDVRNWQLVLLFEWLPKDLMKEIRDRKQSQFMWSGEQLIDLYSQLSSAFAYLQFQGIVHRDIKPHNILIEGSTLKVADFGTSKENPISSLHTVAGTPYFLSPSLKEALLNRQASVKHDVIKSDVYSLGLTFLTMAKLDPPSSLANLQSIPRNTEQEIAALLYDDSIKIILRVMLAIREEDRCDFLLLDSSLKSLISVHHLPDQLLQLLPENKQPDNHASISSVKHASMQPVHQLPLLRPNCCVHVLSQGSIAAVCMPCHGRLCLECVKVLIETETSTRFICRICNKYSIFSVQPSESSEKSDPDPSPQLIAEVQREVPLSSLNLAKSKQEPDKSELKEASFEFKVECEECKLVKNRALLLPFHGKPLCQMCLEYYEKYEHLKYASPDKTI